MATSILNVHEKDTDDPSALLRCLRANEAISASGCPCRPVLPFISPFSGARWLHPASEPPSAAWDPLRLVSSSGAVAELLPHFVSELVSRECNTTGHPHLCVGRRNAQNMRVHCPVTPWSCSAHTTPHEPRTLVDPHMGASDGVEVVRR